MRRNWILYGSLLLGVFLVAVLYGDPFMFMALYSLIAMPLASFTFAAATLFGMEVSQKSEGTMVIKGEANRYFITLHNRIGFGFGIMRCMFLGEHFAVETTASKLRVNVRPFMKPVHFPMDFTIKYRGVYQLGLKNLEITDFLGLFKIRRKVSANFKVIAYPRAIDLEHMQLVVHMLSKASSNLAIAQEDYTDYTDVRPYAPSDPIKKVHWKLTAKRGEWVVKNYQSSALNGMAILLDSVKRDLPYKNTVKLEDAMMEHAVSVIRHCLRHKMPIDLIFGECVRETGKHIGDFDAIYNVMANLEFVKDDYSVHKALSGYLNETNCNVNVIILTSTLDMPLYERALNAVRFGHYIAILYFVSENWKPDKESDTVFERLKGSGLNCVKV